MTTGQIAIRFGIGIISCVVSVVLLNASGGGNLAGFGALVFAMNAYAALSTREG